MPKVTKTLKKAEVKAKKPVAPKEAVKAVKKAAVEVKKDVVLTEKEVTKAVKAVNKDIKRQTVLVKKYRGSSKDTGSIGVQIALLTDRIDQLAKHLTKHLHDFDSKRGLLILVGKRRRLLNYIRKNDEKLYTGLVKDLKLKK